VSAQIVCAGDNPAEHASAFKEHASGAGMETHEDIWKVAIKPLLPAKHHAVTAKANAFIHWA
jgi:hypothetical protein